MQTRNSKLDSFLKRKLEEERYERIRAYESCIVVSEKENKTFKYVVLGDEWIYLTENPPKTIQEVVCLEDLVSVDLVNDFPDFLMGQERENTQHIAVVYMSFEHVRKRLLRKSKKSPRNGSISDLHGDRSNASTPLSHVSSQDFWPEDNGYMTQSTTSLQVPVRSDSRSSVGSTRNTGSKKKKKTNKASEGGDENLLKSLKEEREEDLEEQSQYANSMSKSQERYTPRNDHGMDTARKNSARPLPKSPRDISTAKGNMDNSQAPPLPKKSEFKDSEVVESTSPRATCCCSCLNGKTSSKVSPLSCSTNTAVETTNTKMKAFDSSIMDRMSEVSVPTGTGQRRHYVQSVRNPVGSKQSVSDPVGSRLSENDLVGSRLSVQESRHSSMSTLRGTSRAGTPAQETDDRRSLGGIASSYSDMGGSVTGRSLLGVDGVPEKKKTVLNIYLLNNVSPMLMLIRSAWSNYLIRATLQFSQDYQATARSDIVFPKNSQNQREKMELLFQQLKRELLNPSNTMEKTFELLNELRTATEKNFALKKLFWKSPDIFNFFLRQLQKYLPKSKVNVNSDSGRKERADELEFVILVIEIVCLMFRESEIIVERNTTLKAERGRSALDLLMVLTCVPEIPKRYAISVARFTDTDDITEADAEIEKLMLEFRKNSIHVVSELFLMAKQANWSNSEDSFFNLSWMVKTMEEIKSTEKYVDEIIKMMLKMISPKAESVLSPEDTVLLYQQFFVLQIFFQHSPKIRSFICANYLEEFRYYVQGPAIRQRISPSYPICATTLTIIEQVMTKIMESAKLLGSKTPRP
ncbi:hypothetical protein ACJMK2_015534 [Sinanodonta woodiana]|uniref:Ras-GEF domain-containing protein n=1 Tax=Sinanodonta woodiana TaxID=1069815 RepID=A0ABD3UQN0_SINWO